MSRCLLFLITALTFTLSGQKGFGQCVTPIIISNPANGAICPTKKDTLTITNPVSGMSYQWYKGAVQIKDTISSLILVNEAGVYKASCNNGATFSNTITVTIIPPPTGTITVSPNTTVCFGTQVTLNVSTDPGNVYYWFMFPPNPVIFPWVYTATYTQTAQAILGDPVTTCTNTISQVISVNPLGQVNQPSGQIACNGTNTTLIAFSTTNLTGTTTYSWTNNNTAIGLAASGTGNISPFLATNTGNGPIFGTITVTPTYTNGGVSCVGPSKTFTITVNPSGKVIQPTDLVFCHNAQTTIVSFSTTNTGGTTTYSWTNSNTSIGLAASGTGSIPSFTAINTGSSPVVSLITVTPTFTNEGLSCTGVARTFTITINPPGQVDPPANQVVCNGQNTTALTFSTTNTGGTTTYAWTNNNTTIGLAGSGTGNIASFSAINTGTAPVVATITVTPTFTIGSVGCTGPSQTFTITVNPPAQVSQPASQVVCVGSSTSLVTFTTLNTGGTTTYSWTNNNTSIGLPVGGTGNILPFVSTNSTSAPIVATITVNAQYTNGGVTCTGSSKTFTITVNPLGQVNQPANMVVCNGQYTTVVTFATANTGGTTTYTWTNSLTGIGLTASGTGNIASFQAVNNTTAPLVATITVTPHFTNGSVTCDGPVKTFTITVNPGGQVNQPASQVLCKGDQTTAITFSTNNTGGTTTYAWSNNNTSIGLAASGTGDIAPFTTLNTGTAPAVATITVTPTYSNFGTTCSGQSTTFTITVNPLGQAIQPANQTVCHNSATALITFTTANTGGTTTYSWTNNNTSIGLAASGTGNISSFTATNTGTSPAVGTIIVTPTFTNGGISCTGPTRTFTITVNPPGQVNQPANQVVCSGQSTSLVTFSTTNTGGTTTYTWTNNNTTIGLAGSGSGNIPSFTALNAGTSPVAATITVVATYTIGTVGCTGPSQTFTITVNPPAQVTQPSSQVVCTGSTTSLVTFNTNNTGGTTTYSWTNNTISIGLAASGTGNIPAFTAVNSTTSPVVATITVSPSFTNGGVTCTGPSKTFTITVNPLGQVNQPADQVVCNGENTATVSFSTINTGGTTTYTWTNTLPGIGLAASGTGIIASFTAVNATTLPVTATITVTPHFTNGAVTCTGTVKIFTITVNPGGQMNQPANQVLCKGDQTAAITFSTNNTGGTTSYSWANDNTNIGLAATGTGNIAPFTTLNTGTSPAIATITVTPTYTNNGTTCSGPSKIFTITANPIGQVNQPADQVVCHNSATAAITFVTVNTAGTTSYSWTNTNPTIGLAASGTGNISSFTAINAGNTALVATITVTPTFLNGGMSCIGSSATFSITVNPGGQVNQPSSQVLCNGQNTTAVAFSTTNTGGTTTYSWTNSAPGIGLPPTGAGDIASFIATNNGTVPVVATIVVIPTYTIGAVGCPGASKSFTITVNPTAQVTQPSSQVVCAGSSTSLITFTTLNTVGSTTYTWTNNTTSIGLAATGTGNILPFTAINSTTAPVVATITVSPSYTNAGVTCSGSSKTFTITVNPLGQVNQPDNQAVCNGEYTTAVTFSTTNTVGTTSYTWTNSLPGIGLASSGTGNIALFQTINTGTLPAVAIITVTPHFANGLVTCDGPSKTFTITVNPGGQMNQPASQVLCRGDQTTAIVFSTNNTGGTTTYSWTNDNANIGLAASGTGNIASFATLNTGTSPAIATITVTPTYSNNGTTCSGPSKTFTITVNPLGQVNQPSDLATCHNTTLPTITFSSANTGGVTTYAWNNNNTAIGLTASGTGNITAFTATNTGSTSISATITVTPTYSNAGTSCLGASKSFIITVNPTGQVNQPGNQEICNGVSTAAISFSTTNTGGTTTYSWTNNATSIGLAASGTGDISSFNAINNGSQPVIATIIVTPYYATGSVNCQGPTKTFTITVNPIPQIANSSLSKQICTNQPVGISLTSNTPAAGTIYTWASQITTPPSGGTITGLTNCNTNCGSILNDNLINTGSSFGVVTYDVIPSFAQCVGSQVTFTVTIQPTVTLTCAPISQEICSGTLPVAINISSNVSGATLNWTAVASTPGSITGFLPSGTSYTINPQVITSILNTAGTVTYTIIPTISGCSSSGTSHVITVNPAPVVTNDPARQSTCSGATTNPVPLTSNISNPSFTWHTLNTPANLTGYITGLQTSSTIPAMTITNSASTADSVIYEIIPSFTGGSTSCSGVAKQYVFVVKPKPIGSSTPSSVSICSGANAQLQLVSSVTGSSFTWNAANAAGHITGHSGCLSACGTSINQPLNLASGYYAKDSVIYTITPTANGCRGDGFTTKAVVKPNPNVTFSPAGTAICSAITTNISLGSGAGSGVSYAWGVPTVVPAGSVAGGTACASGCGTSIQQLLTNTGNITSIVSYSVTGSFEGCSGQPTPYDVTVYPIPQVTNTTLTTSICSGQQVGISLTSNVTTPPATFTWTASSADPFIAGFSNSSGTTINQTLTNTGTTDGAVTYIVTAQANGCDGPTATFTVTVHPVPGVNFSISNPQSICSGSSFPQANLTSAVLGASFTWTINNPGNIAGTVPCASGCGIFIPSATLTSTLNATDTVKYIVMPAANGCSGTSASLKVAVFPAAGVTLSPARQVKCSGIASEAVGFTSSVAGASYSWQVINSPANLTGYTQGTQTTSSIPPMTITNTGTTIDSVIYQVTPSFTGGSTNCPGVAANCVIVVNPKPAGTATPASQPICSGQPASFALGSNVTGTGFTWTAAAANNNVTGFTNCSSACPNPVNGTYTLNAGIYSTDSVIYTITPSANNCNGDNYVAKVIVRPNPNVLFNPASLAMCSGDFTNITLTSGSTGVTFSWTTTLIQGSATGFSDATGNLIHQAITNTGTVDAQVKYTVTPATQYCSGTPLDYIVTIHPVPDVSNTPLSKSICSNTSTAINLTSNVLGTTFNWTASSSQTFITGYSASSGLAINQTLQNSGIVDGSATYVITPIANGCSGLPVSYSVTVHPVAIASCSIPTQEICSGDYTTPVNLSSTVAGSTFTWSCTPSSPLITGWSAGTGNVITPQNLISGLNTQGTVTYTVTPQASGCDGTIASHIVTVNPSPTVTNTPLNQGICSQSPSTAVILTSNVPGTTFTWTASASSPQVTGFTLSGGGTIFAQTITNSSLIPQFVTYKIVPNFTGSSACAGDTVNYVINVLPKPQVTSLLLDSVCSANPFSYTINSSVANSTFNWTRGAVIGISNPAASGTTPLINETLINTTAADINVTYQLTVTGPGAPACPSNVTPLVVRVKDYMVYAGDDITIPHGISTDLAGQASGGGGNLYYTWQPSSLIQTGLHTLTPHTKNIYADTTFYLMVSDQNMSNCLKQDSVRISLNGSALAANPYVDPDLVCAGGTAQLFANPSGGSGVYVAFTWSSVPPGVPVWTSSQQNPIINPFVPATYTVIVNDGFNTATGSCSIQIKTPPDLHTITGGGAYCSGGTGVTIGLDGTTSGDVYRIVHNGVTGPPVDGTGSAISFGTFTDPGVYTAQATSNSMPQCTIAMTDSATVVVIPLPSQYPVTGGGTYSQGGIGLPVGLGGSQAGVEYELIFNDTMAILPRITGTGGAISFGNQTLGGTYRVIAYTLTTPVCTRNMLDSAIIIVNPWPTVYNLLGGGDVCADDSTGIPIWLQHSESGIDYQLFRNGLAIGPVVLGTNDSILFGYYHYAGLYRATGTNQITGLMKYMRDSVIIVIHPLPLVYVMGSFGDNCPGTQIMLNGSQTGVNYELQLNTVPIDTMPGTGSVLNFGPQTGAGTYRIRAYDIVYGCDTIMDNSILINPAPTVFNIRPIGVSCAGDTISITGSQLGILYQLRLNNSTNVGIQLPGTGFPLSFGSQSLPGMYTVEATNPQTNCHSVMNGVAEFNPLPVPYNMIPQGDTCEAVTIKLSGSQPGVLYILKRDTLWVDTLTGTGGLLVFGSQTIPGVYTIMGVDTTSYKFCSNMMFGSTIIHPAPVAYLMSPAGYACAGDTLRLLDSDQGVLYQLILNNNQSVGPVVTGTGSMISFGPQILPGDYTVRARNPLTNCWTNMTGIAHLSARPLAFNIIPAGDTCSGTPISLNGSQTGVKYILQWNNIPVSTLLGTGNTISFGAQTISGLYTVRAINLSADSCQMMMTGTLYINEGPFSYQLMPPGNICADDTLWLSDSQLGVEYQLIRNNWENIGAPVAGTGAPISFGWQTQTGSYTVSGKVSASPCWAPMTGTTTILQGPSIYSMIPQGDTCANSVIWLSGSQTGKKYTLIRDEIYPVLTITGTGNSISFGSQQTIGTYKIIGQNISADSCSATMLGTLTLHPNPEPHNIIPNGLACVGDTIKLSYSQVGFDYQLWRGGTLMNTMAGTDGLLNFGAQLLTGTYTIIGLDPVTHCWTNMVGSVKLSPIPTIFQLMPSGDTCERIPIGINGSELNIRYTLRHDGMPVESKYGTGIQLWFDYQTTSGTYTVIAQRITADSCSALMNGTLVIHPLPLAYTLMPAGANCEPATVFLSNVQSGVEYRLIKNGIQTGVWQTGASFGAQFAGTYRALGRFIATSCIDTMAGTVVITGRAVAFAGTDTTACSGHSITLIGSATEYASVHWLTRGDGSFVPNPPNILNPVYQPGASDIATGSVWLILEVTGTAPCAFQVSRDSLLLTLEPGPVANAGPNDTICEGANFTTAAASATNYSMPRWSSSGSGTFTFGADTLHTSVYQPSPADIALGWVNLTLTVHGSQSCAVDSVTDVMTLRIVRQPIADAGPDDTICENQTYQLAGSRLYSTTSHWETLGDGTFDDITLLNALYTSGINDTISGTVTLFLVADGSGQCGANKDTNYITIQLHHLPFVTAGPDDMICASQSYQVPSSYAVRYSTILWTTGGDGTFDNSALLHPVYTPGTADTTNHAVTLTITTHGTAQCISETRADSLVLNFHPMPVAMAGADTNGCPNEPMSIAGNAHNYSAILWHTLGDGVFTAPTALATDYNSGVNDRILGYADLLLTVTGTAQCQNETDTDTVRVIYHPLPLASVAGLDTICENDSTAITFHLTGTAPWTVVYTDGMNTFTKSNIQTSPYALYVKPVTTTSYFLVSVHDYYCTGTVQGGSATIYVNQSPILYQFAASNNGIYCQGTNGVELTLDNSQQGISYQLYFNNGSSGPLQFGTGNPLTFGWVTTAGAYKVLCTVIQTQCYRYTDSIFVNVMPLPVVNFSADSTCIGDSTHFLVSGADIGKISLWTWNFGDGTSATYSNPENPAHLYPVSGTFHVFMDALDTNGCTRIIDHYVTVGSAPVSNFAYQQINCATNNVTFTDLSHTSNLGYITQWHWFFGDGNDLVVDWPNNPNITHIYASAGNYQVLLRIHTSRGCSDTSSHVVVVNPQPNTNFSYSSPCQEMATHFTDLTTLAGGNTVISWLWDFGDPGSGTGNSSTLQNPYHTYVTAGLYPVKLKVATQNGCIDSTLKQVQVKLAPLAIFTADTTCVGDFTNFTDQSVANDGTLSTWLWDFGDGTTPSAVQNPTHLYGTTGLYPVHLTVTNSNQCSHDTIIAIQVYPLPVAAFISNAPKCKGTPVTFTSQSTSSHGTIIQWHWEWGDGTDTTVNFPGAISVNHTYTTPAMQYTVRLTVLTNLGCSSFIEQTIQNLPGPTADYTVPPVTCQQQTLTFSDLSTGNGGLITSWHWNFGDPGSGIFNISNLQNPQHTYATDGNYSVELIVTTVNTCTDIISKPIVINQQPVADFSADTACVGSATQFTNQSVPNAASIITYDWDFGDGSTHLHTANPSHTYAVPGIYNVVLTITNSNGCIHSVTKPVQILQAPAALFNTTTNNCTGSPVSVHDQSVTPSGNIVEWTWNFGDGTIITINFPTPQDTSHIYQLSGTYNITLTVKTSDSCTASHTIPVTIHSLPQAAFTYPLERCEASAIHFTDTSLPSNGGAIQNWLWNFGDPTSGINNTSTQQNPDHIFLTFGSFDVTLVITNINGCKDTVTHAIYIHDAPFVDFTADTACIGDTTHFADISALADSLIAWQWTFGDGSTSNLQNPVHLYASPGIYTVTLAVTNQANCTHDTLHQVLVRPVPTASFTVVNNCQGVATVFTDQSFTTEGVLTTWSWDFGDGQTSNLPSPTHLYLTYGTFTVTLTVQNSYGCSGSYSKNVVIYRNPVANFTFTNSFCPAGYVSFSDHSTAYNTTLSSWDWTFEPGYGAQIPNPGHTFNVTDTTYQVQLFVTDMNGCSDTLTAPVFVKPGFDFTFNANIGCTGNITEFIPVNLAPGDSLLSVNWTFGDPASGSANYSVEYIGTHQYPNPGNYIVKMKAVNSDLCTDSIVKTVTIIKGPVAGFDYLHIPHCDTTVKFVNKVVTNGVALSVIQWIFPDTTIIDTPPFMDTVTYKFASFGSFPVTMTVEAVNGCTSTATSNVLVSCISAGFIASTPPRCSGQPVSFSDQSAPSGLISNWNWDFGDGTDTVYTKYTPIIKHRYLADGIYQIRLVISSISGIYVVRDTIIHQLEVILSPESNFSVPGVCLGVKSDFINLTDTTQVPITGYYWTFGDPASGTLNQSSLANPDHFYAKTGKFNVTLITTNQGGCRDTLVKKATVYKLPQANFSYSPLCARDVAPFTDLSKQGDTLITNWFWDFGDIYDPEATSNLEEPSHRYEMPGTYTLFYRITDGFGCMDTLSAKLLVNPTPISAFSFTQDYDGIPGQMKFKNLSQNAIHYYWKFGNGKSSTLENPPAVRYNDDSKTYLIDLISTNTEGCSDTTTYEYKFLFHGLYVPNAFSPTHPDDSVKIFMPKGRNLLSYHITIYDSWGHLLWEDSELDPATGAIVNSWDGYYKGELLPQGTYVWKISAIFTDGVDWEGSDNGKGNTGTIGTVVLFR